MRRLGALPLIMLCGATSVVSRQPRFGPTMAEFTSAMEIHLPASIEGQAAGWHCKPVQHLHCRLDETGNARCQFRDRRASPVKTATLEQKPNGLWTVLSGDHPQCRVTIW